MFLVVTRAPVVLAGDAIVVAVETIMVVARPTVLDEEDLGGSLSRKVNAVPIGGESSRGQSRKGQGEERDNTTG
ncbi:MAG TPA: hypothetical protein VN758_02255 [Solirubrobacterales bacterium]|nr:hypothetical protein [Solirubrobacterales bacterium]